jgi:hypothetical protein
MNLFYIPAVALSQCFSVDICINERDFIFIPNIAVPGLSRFDNASVSSVADVKLTIGHESEIVVSRADTLNTTIFNREIIINENLTFGDVTLDPYRRVPFTDITVGIGPGSAILNTHSRISLLRNRASNYGSLILNDSDASRFNSSCIPDSITHVPFHYRADHGMPHWVGVEYRLVWQDQSTTLVNHMVPTRLGAESRALTLPAQLYDTIQRTMTSHGTFLNGTDVSNCSRAILVERLPHISMTFPSSGSKIVLYPEDYLRFNESNVECRLNIFRSPPLSQTFSFNPLMIPEVNIHISNNEIIVCDMQ